ncbi:hypothetical protein [Streptomyces sp. NPDC020983]|uniref:hypothetical protein n=1 Tax=Streptomyces sp. NPDC020983 TaxID=3365106 RepID=UPI0037BC2C08
MTVGREAVLVAAVGIEAEGGNATVEVLAETLEVNPEQVRGLFPDDGAVYGALQLFAAQRVAAAVDAAGPEGEEPARAVHHVVRQLLPEWAFVTFLLDEGPWLDEEPKALWAAAVDRIDAVFVRGQRTGAFCGDLSGGWLSENLLEPVTETGYEVSHGNATVEEAGEDLASSTVRFAAEPFHEPPGRCAQRALTPNPVVVCGPRSTCQLLRRSVRPAGGEPVS